MSAIAKAVGFRTHAHFSGVFRHYVGRPPKAFQRAQRAMGSDRGAIT